MKAFVNFWKRENGLSLVELLAVISVSSLVLGLIYSVTIFGMNTYKKIEIEGHMREEADIIMSSIFQKLYTTGASEMEQGKDESGNTAHNVITLKRTNELGTVQSTVDISLVENGLRIVDGPNESLVELTTAKLHSDSSIIVTCTNAVTASCSHGMISIELLLESKTSDTELKLESKFGF